MKLHISELTNAQFEAFLTARDFDARYQDPRVLDRCLSVLEQTNARLKYIRPLKLKLAQLRRRQP